MIPTRGLALVGASQYFSKPSLIIFTTIYLCQWDIRQFYEQIFRLREWGRPEGVKRPGVIGKYTNDFVYERLAPGVLDELRTINPIISKGYRKHKHFQWFTTDLGHPKLKEHLAAVIALMRASSTWDKFKNSLNRALPKKGETIPIDIDSD